MCSFNEALIPRLMFSAANSVSLQYVDINIIGPGQPLERLFERLLLSRIQPVPTLSSWYPDANCAPSIAAFCGEWDSSGPFANDPEKHPKNLPAVLPIITVKRRTINSEFKTKELPPAIGRAVTPFLYRVYE